MIHYHGTPIGGSRQDAARFLMGRHALVSFAYPEDLPAVADVCQSFILDNGTFTIWRKGGKLNYQAYTEWVQCWHRHPGFDFAIIPDLIDGNERKNDKLLQMWPAHLIGVPVFHLHESLERLERCSSGTNVWRLASLRCGLTLALAGAADGGCVLRRS
jgi:hypothetical protein